MRQSHLFDLNIEQVLESWGPEHAVREIIANALDEQILTQSKDIEIFKTENAWHIRDYGRGLQYSHFTQNENKEKTESPFLIGKFGVGLKDALAVFYRNGIHVEIESKHAHITLVMTNKADFDLQTLHASFEPPKDANMVGTDFILTGISDDAINKAKSLFLCFNQNIKLLETTTYGQVYSCHNTTPTIYINGVQVALEENFLFSYNITNINAQIKKALNRERSNVGRTAYSAAVKNILQQCKTYNVLRPLIDDLENYMTGSNKDESGWVDVATYAALTLDETDNVVFMTPGQRDTLTNEKVEILTESGRKLIMVTDNVYSKIKNRVCIFDTIYKEYYDAFQYTFVNYDSLTPTEKQTFDLKDQVLTFLKQYNCKCGAKIKVSETIRVDTYGGIAQGVCDFSINTIIIKRSVLQSKQEFLGVLLHEFAHYQHNYLDNTRDFENDLTNLLGYAFFEYIKSNQ